MAAAPVRVPIESRSIGHDADRLRFQRLERVRAQRRARRRSRLFVVTTLAMALAGVGVLGFITVRGTAFGRLAFPISPAPVEMVKPAAAWPAATGSAFDPPSAVTPRSTGADAVRHDTTQPPRITVDSEQRASPPSKSPERGEVTPSRKEPHDAEGVDPAAAIDWLLKTSRARGADGREEKLQ